VFFFLQAAQYWAQRAVQAADAVTLAAEEAEIARLAAKKDPDEVSTSVILSYTEMRFT
jgi:hypothetical protein